MYNQVTLIGRLGADPEVRQINETTTVVNLSVATNKKVKEQEYTEWHRVQAWNKLGDVCAQYLNKGRLVAVVGELRYKKYTNKDGVEVTSAEVHATDVKFLDKPGSGDGAESGQSRAYTGGQDDEILPY